MRLGCFQYIQAWQPAAFELHGMAAVRIVRVMRNVKVPARVASGSRLFLHLGRGFFSGIQQAPRLVDTAAGDVDPVLA